MQTCGFTRLVPVETLIVDEASQISLADYLAPVNVFGKTLRKLVFVGDDKQRTQAAPLRLVVPLIGPCSCAIWI